MKAHWRERRSRAREKEEAMKAIEAEGPVEANIS
jgi:hypothetical protein